MTYERRTFAMELRSEAGELPTIRGYAAVFDQLSEDLGGGFFSFRERIVPGAFDEALERVESGQDDVYALLNHDPSLVIASTADKSLRVSADAKGLLSVMEPMDTQTIRDLVVTPVRRGVLRKMSFGFNVSDEHPEKEEGQEIRVIEKISQLFDVSVVTFPAYRGTSVQASSILRALGVPPERLSGPELYAATSFVRTISRHLPVAPVQVDRAPDAQPELTGVSAGTLERLEDLRRHSSERKYGHG